MMTLLDAIIQSLSCAGEYNRDNQAAPALVVWPDKGCLWGEERDNSSRLGLADGRILGREIKI